MATERIIPAEEYVAIEDDPYDDTWYEDESRVWRPGTDIDLEPIIIHQRKEDAPKLPRLTPSQFTEFAFRMPSLDGIGEDGQGYDRFTFNGRRHMRDIYDTSAKKLLLKCARQVEKSGRTTSYILLPDGSRKLAGDVRVGERLAMLSMPSGSSMSAGTVTWVSRRYYKPCVRIQTRQGHICEVATTHPMRTWRDWLEAGSVRKGDRLAVVRRSGEFLDEDTHEERVKLTAFMIGDGHIGRALSFTALPGPVLDDFMQSLEDICVTARLRRCKRSRAFIARVHVGLLHEWLTADGLRGTHSDTKFVPKWVYRLSKRQTSLFLNRLWSTDGHVKRLGKSSYEISYCSTSPRLIREVQALLWKFGIPSGIRSNWPSYHKKKGVSKYAYILRVETQEGLRTFLEEVGALGKCEDVGLPDAVPNNNRDTYPLAINNEIREIIASRGDDGRRGRKATNSLRSVGLRETLEYPLSKGKLHRYVDFFGGDKRYDQKLVKQLKKHLDTDLYWDEVVAVTHIGEQECIDFDVEGSHNFVCDGFITHNSTLLGNISLAYMSLIPAYKVLYVNSSATQAKTFSADRIRDPIETSPLLKRFTTQMLSSNILEKQFINRSKITLRYAYLNADRTRGIPAYLLAVDEIQDILHSNLPTMEQCLAHAPDQFRRQMYAGTPKSLDNTIETYWSNQSTQNEWVVPHDCKGGDAGRFWNILGEKNIGKKGLICSNCGTVIDPMHVDSQWASMVEYDPVNTPFDGYRIPQLMVPWKPWVEILGDYKNYPREKFYNEVLGISFDSGLRPLTRAQVRAACNEKVSLADVETYRPLSYTQPVFAGIDWGAGGTSYTVISLGTYVDSVFRIFYVHRFVGEDVEPDRQLDRIAELIDYFNVEIVMADYGGGYYPNNTLVRRFGLRRIHKLQWMGRINKKFSYDSGMGRWKGSRTELLSDVFNAIKRACTHKRMVEFPKWDEFKDPYAQDLLNVYSEYNDRINQLQYRNAKGKPDDTLHSVTYCLLASTLKIPRQDIFIPRPDGDAPDVFASDSPADQW